jgi:type III pantothenate kinase
MLLVADIGNTNTVFGLWDLETDNPIASWRASTRRDRMPDEWLALLSPLFSAAGHALSDVRAVILSSVVPSVSSWLSQMVSERLGIEPILVTVDLDLGMRVLTDNPREVGADRIVNTVAAYARYGGPAIVIDLGTATTFDVVSPEGDYLGGAIAPGLTISLEALSSRAARLFTVDLSLPSRAIGTNTIASMQSGLVLGYLAMLEGMIVRIRAELAADAPVIITGGYAEIFADASPLIVQHDPDLTIFGLRLIYQRVTSTTD